MTVTGKLVRLYFDNVYNRVYDLTTARLTRYRKLQETSIGKISFMDNDKILCVGIGTGNEITKILENNPNVSIVGVDYSKTALRKAREKASRFGKNIELHQMDVSKLNFPPQSFDKLLCLHVMDFVDDMKKVTREILRVMKKEGQFVITYPSSKEGMSLGVNLIKDGIHNDSGWRGTPALLPGILMKVVMAPLYLPLLLRPHKVHLTRDQLIELLKLESVKDFEIEEERVYQDFIVYGKKGNEGGL